MEKHWRWASLIGAQASGSRVWVPSLQIVRQQVPPGCELPPYQPALLLQCTPPPLPHAFSVLAPQPGARACLLSIVTPLGAREPRVPAPLWHPAAQACVPHHSHAWGCQKDGKHKHRWISHLPLFPGRAGASFSLNWTVWGQHSGSKGNAFGCFPLSVSLPG